MSKRTEGEGKSPATRSPAVAALSVLVLTVASSCGGSKPPSGPAPTAKTPAGTTAPEANVSGSGSTAATPSGSATVSRAYRTAAVKNPATLRAEIRYDGGVAPERKPLTVTADVDHCGGKVFQDDLIVDATSLGIKNAVLRLEGVKYGKAPPKELMVTNKSCAFEPRVQVAMKNTVFKARNEDPIAHTTHPYYESGSFFNFPFTKGGATEFPGAKIKRDGLIKITCDVHSWMRGYVVVHENPYIAVSDGKGQLVLDEIPPGTYSYVLWHEKLGEKKGKVTLEADKQAELSLTLGK